MRKTIIYKDNNVYTVIKLLEKGRSVKSAIWNVPSVIQMQQLITSIAVIFATSAKNSIIYLIYLNRIIVDSEVINEVNNHFPQVAVCMYVLLFLGLFIFM